MPTIPWTTARTTANPPRDAPAVAMASRFDLHQHRRVPGFLLAAMRIRRQMLAAPGVLGVSLIAKPLDKTFFTLSAWQDREALDAAVLRQPHEQEMTRLRPHMANSRFVFWEPSRSDVPPTWTDAMRRLEDVGD